MPQYRIHHMKDQPRESFRAAPHVSAPATVKPKDYEASGEIDAPNEYEAWMRLRDTDRPLSVGDLLEMGDGELRICKYVGFEPAKWWVPEALPAQPSESEAR